MRMRDGGPGSWCCTTGLGPELALDSWTVPWTYAGMGANSGGTASIIAFVSGGFFSRGDVLAFYGYSIYYL